MIELPTLYAHQETMRDDIRNALAKHRRAILEAPPGTGKTRTAKWILGSYANRPQRDGETGQALFVVHRRGLVDNASKSFQQSPELPHGLIMSGRKTNHPEPIQVASIDTLNAWYVAGEQYTGLTFDLICFDECHAHVPTFRTFLAGHDAKRAAHGKYESYVLGLSATPQHKELNQVFRTIVKGPSTQWLIDNRYLSPFRYFRGVHGNAGKLIRRGDEYTKDSVCEAMQGLCGSMVADWKRYAKGRATIGFFPRRVQAFEAMEMFRDAGVNAVYLDGETSDEDRLQMFSDLNCGRIDYIANVGVIERGTDIPRVSCIQMCVFVGSIVRWLQMIGRGSRTCDGKTDCLVLDHGDGVKKGWFFEDTVNWSLEWGERPAKTHEAPATIECPNPNCRAAYRGGKCKLCGYEPTPKQRASQGLEFVGGELREVHRTEKTKQTKTPEEIMISALYIAGNRNLTFGAACKIARDAADTQGVLFRVPASFEVAGKRYRAIPFGSSDTKRRVRDTYGFTVRNDSVEANPYRER